MAKEQTAQDILDREKPGVILTIEGGIIVDARFHKDQKDITVAVVDKDRGNVDIYSYEEGKKGELNLPGGTFKTS